MNSLGLKHYFIVGFGLTLILTPFFYNSSPPGRSHPSNYPGRSTEDELAESLRKTSFGR